MLWRYNNVPWLRRPSHGIMSGCRDCRKLVAGPLAPDLSDIAWSWRPTPHKHQRRNLLECTRLAFLIRGILVESRETDFGLSWGNFLRSLWPADSDGNRYRPNCASNADPGHVFAECNHAASTAHSVVESRSIFFAHSRVRRTPTTEPTIQDPTAPSSASSPSEPSSSAPSCECTTHKRPAHR
jgi:hypothetical protein